MIKLLPKPGQRIELVSMSLDPDPILPGSRGTVLGVKGVMRETHIEVAWDNGRMLSLIASIDQWAVVSRE